MVNRSRVINHYSSNGAFYCGTRVGIESTHVKAEVTCKRCLAKIAKVRAPRKPRVEENWRAFFGSAAPHLG